MGLVYCSRENVQVCESLSGKNVPKFCLEPECLVVITTYSECTHCTENRNYVLPEMKLHGLVPNSYIHVSVSWFITSRNYLATAK
jgi:hypothetical protein